MVGAKVCSKYTQGRLGGKKMEGGAYKCFFERFFFYRKKERDEMVAKKGSVIKNFCFLWLK